MSTTASSPTQAQGSAGALRCWNPWDWLRVFGPGAIIASLTIGAGELIFSSRGGALFGYRVLWFFLLVLVLKWVLVYATARHMVLTGAHPMERWMELPGPRGWLPLVFLGLGIVCFPIWVGFHAGTVGTLVSWLAGTEQAWRGGAHFLWGMGVLGLVVVLVVCGGYATLERIQLVIVGLMLLGVMSSLILLRPDWGELCRGLLWPGTLHYPEWISVYPDLAARPVWVETTTYVGVLGGSGYDYLAYVSYLRAKGWGRAGGPVAGRSDLLAWPRDPADPVRSGLRAVRVDSGLSFLAVLIFSVAFVACGALILGPQHKVPAGTNLLSLQAAFVTPTYPWLKWIYFVGAFLTMVGTLYGTIEVAPAVLQECVASLGRGRARAHVNRRRLRGLAVGGSCLGGFVVLGVSFVWHQTQGQGTPPGLVALLTPANLFTGVLACGFITLLSLWADRRFLPVGLQMPRPLKALAGASGTGFVLLGLKAYWDYNGWIAMVLLALTVALGWVVAWRLTRHSSPD